MLVRIATLIVVGAALVYWASQAAPEPVDKGPFKAILPGEHRGPTAEQILLDRGYGDSVE